MIMTNAHAVPAATRRVPTMRAVVPGLMTESYPMRGGTGDRGLLGVGRDLEGGLLLAPPDFPLVGGGPLFAGDVLEGLDDGLLDVVEPAGGRGLVAGLTLIVAVRAGLLVLDPLLDVLLQLDEGVHGFLLAQRAGGRDSRLGDAGIGVAEISVDRVEGRGILD